jgi:hypothetical protein
MLPIMGLKITLSEWSDQAEALLAPACDDSYSVEEVAADVKSGLCRLFEVREGFPETLVGSFVVRLDAYKDFKELVVVVAGSRYQHGSLYKCITPYVEGLAAVLDAKYLRGHTKSRAVGRLMERAGWEQSEFIYRKRVSNGRQ